MHLQRQIDFLKNAQLPHGLWTAADGSLGVNLRKEYPQYVWPRDCVHIIRALLLAGEVKAAGKGLKGLLTIMEGQKKKLDEVIANPALAYGKAGHYHRFMPRYRREDLSEVTRENGDHWNNFQNDVSGAMLWLLGKAESLGFGFLRTGKNRQLLEQLVSYLRAIKFWGDKDAGFWEEDPHETRTSSLAAVISGLKAIKPFIPVSRELITQGEESLKRLLPYETATRGYDSASLYALDPFGVVDKVMARRILARVEKNLLKENGCLRYPEDRYNALHNNHAEWPLFLFKLAIGYKLVGENKKARSFLSKGLSQVVNGLFPEAFCDGHPINYPLGWASAEAISAIIIVDERYRQEPYFSALVPQLR